MATHIEYQSLELIAGARVISGKGLARNVDAVADRKITRVIDPPLDYYIVEGPGVISLGGGQVEIPASAVVRAIRKPVPAIVAKGGKAKDGG
jgi:hypothetical protein